MFLILFPETAAYLRVSGSMFGSELAKGSSAGDGGAGSSLDGSFGSGQEQNEEGFGSEATTTSEKQRSGAGFRGVFGQKEDSWRYQHDYNMHRQRVIGRNLQEAT